MEYTNKRPTALEYNALRMSSGMGEPKKFDKTGIALDNSLFVVSVYEDGTLIGLGRVVGDGGITFAITDIMVDSYYQHRGIGNEIMNRIDHWLDENTDDKSFVMLFANKPADRLYEKHRFVALDPEKRVGMKRK